MFRSPFPLARSAALLLLGAVSSLAAPFSDLISFGDSLTDVGNVAEITNNGSAPVIPGYYEETHFSDNVIWNETLASYWGLPARTVGRTAVNNLSAQPNGNTWAWGGSEAASGYVTETGVSGTIPNLLTEVDQYLSVNTPDSTALYSIWSGADNLLVGGKFGPEAAQQAVAAVKTAMQELEEAGARNFLIFNMPRMGDTPDAQSGGDVSIAAANLFADSYNIALDAALDELRVDPNFDGAIFFVDAYTELAEIVDTVNNGGTYTPDFFVPGAPVAITNASGMGLDYYQTSGTFPTDYLFWDDVHPTTQGHAIIAGLALQALPEPGTCVLVALGLGFALFRRRRA